MASVGTFFFLLLFFCVSVCLLPIGSPGPVSANLRAIQPRAQRNVRSPPGMIALRSEPDGLLDTAVERWSPPLITCADKKRCSEARPHAVVDDELVITGAGFPDRSASFHSARREDIWI
ncbi:hypothetical protein B0H13DRAFT_1908734 [Mycena leptocephala]|nr:hypothetical protein B0H13DRAFT_1908734 [Mycena leptocephala]